MIQSGLQLDGLVVIIYLQISKREGRNEETHVIFIDIKKPYYNILAINSFKQLKKRTNLKKIYINTIQKNFIKAKLVQ